MYLGDLESDEYLSENLELNRKKVAEAFWTAEVESELRERHDIGYLFTTMAAQDKYMDVIDAERAYTTYQHHSCSESCRKRG